MSLPTVLITGCAGYVGSTMVAHFLRANWRVVGVDNFLVGSRQAVLPYLAHPNFEFHAGTVTNLGTSPAWKALVGRADVVVHLAALVGAKMCDNAPELAVTVNAESVAALVGLLSPSQRLLFPNTNSGYGQTDGNSFVDETSPLNPVSLYGLSKCDGENHALQHPNAVSFRLATVFGVSPRMRLDLLVNDFTWRLCRAKEVLGRCFEVYPRFELYEPHFKRNFVGVHDVARAFLFMAEKDHKGVYNLGLPTANLTKMDLAHLVCDTIGLSREVVRVGSGKDIDQRNYLVSNDKLLSTGFSFKHQLADGVREVEKLYHLNPETDAMRNA